MKGNIISKSGDITLDGEHSVKLTYEKDLDQWIVEIEEKVKE